MASYSEGDQVYMRRLAKEQGITYDEMIKRRRWDDEHSTLDLGPATISEFEPIIGSNKNAGFKPAPHADTSHIGAEERATGKAVGGTVGGIVAAMMGLPPQVGVAAGSALGGGGTIGETTTSALGATADEIKPGDEGKIKDFLKQGTDVPDVWGHPAR